MKRSLILLLFAAFSAVSCGTAAQYATTESRFQDGIYYKPKPVEPSTATDESEESEQDYILVDPYITFPYSITSPWYHNPWYHSPWYYDRWSWSWGWNHWDPWYYNRWSWKWDWNWRYWDPWYYEMWCWDPLWDPFWGPGWGPRRWWGPGWGAWEPVGPIGPGGMRRDVYYGHRGATNVGGTVYSSGRGRTGGAGTIRGGIGSGSYVNYGAHRSSGTGTSSNYSYPKGTAGTSGGGLRRSFEGSTSSGTSSNNRSSNSYSRGSTYSGGSSYSAPSSAGSYGGGGSHSGGSGGHSGGGGSHGGHR